MSEKKNSASQVDLYQQCPRKWGYRYLDKIRMESPYFGLGKRVHAILEAWLKDGHLPDPLEVIEFDVQRKRKQKDTGEMAHVTEHEVYYPGQVAEAGLHLLPPPGVAHVESKYEWRTPESQWVGYLDGLFIEDERGEAMIPDHMLAHMPGHVPVILDHKTKRDLKYAHTEETLREDIQANLYAYSVMDAFGVNLVKNRWIYYSLDGKPQAKRVEVVFEKSEVDERVQAIDQQAKKIEALYSIRPKTIDLTPNVEACDWFGGCEHKARCNLSNAEKIGAYKMGRETFEGLMDKLAGQRAAKMPTVIEPPAPPLPPPLPAQQLAMHTNGTNARPAYWMPNDPLNDTQDYLQSKGASLYHIAAAADVPPPNEVLDQWRASGPPINGITHATVERVHINPPEAPAFAPAHPVEMPPPPKPPPPSPVLDDEFQEMGREQLKQLAVEAGLIDPSSRLRAEGLRQELRAAKAKGVKFRMSSVTASGTSPGTVTSYITPRVEEDIPLPPPVPPPSLEELRMPSSVEPPVPISAGKSKLQVELEEETQRKGFTLYIDCAPMDMENTFELQEVLKEVLPQLEKALEVSDYRLVDYGKGAGLLSAAVDEFLRNAELGVEVGIVVSTITQEGQHCLGTLMRLAGRVVRAYR